MRAMAVARKDYEDAIQSRTLWGLTAVLVVFTCGLAYSLTASDLLAMFWPFFLTFFTTTQLQNIAFTHFYLGPATALIPLVALVITHKSIIGEIESGSVKFLLSVPLTRADTVFGKLAGRTAVMSTALIVGLTATGVFVALFGDDLQFTNFFIVLLYSLLFGLAYVSIGVALSAVATSEARAVVYAVAVFVFMQIGMTFANNVVYMLLNGTFFPPLVGTSGPPDVDGWWYLILRLTPGGAFRGAVIGLVDVQPFFQPAFPEGIPFYLKSGVSTLILLFWSVVPISLGYLRFRDSDIL